MDYWGALNYRNQSEKNIKLKRLQNVLSCILSLFVFGHPLAIYGERFEGFEIRVIRPRYFSKSGRLEIGTNFQAITNQTFVYTYLFGGTFGYHFSESFGFEVEGTYGLSIDKADTLTLDGEFNIKTQIIRTKFSALGSLMWTPIYGKYQLSSGDVMYFDTFLSAGGGVTGVEYLYDHCTSGAVDLGDDSSEDAAEETVIPTPKSVPYPGGTFGGGQRLFLSKQTAVKWEIKDSFFTYNSVDGACTPDVDAVSTLHHNIVIKIGLSRFF